MTPTRKPAKARDRILEDHREIGMLLSKIAGARGATESATLAKNLLPLLTRHFQEEEAEISGLHASIRQRSPHHVYALQELRVEHSRLLDATRHLLDVAGRADQDDVEVAALGRQLKDDVAAHETKETALFVDSIWTDLGEGD